MGGKLFQLHTTFAAAFGQLSLGILYVWPSYTSGIYSSNSTTLSEPMTEGEISLLGSLPSLGAMVGTAVVGTLINRLGRKNGGIAMSLPYLISWAMISLTTSKNVVLIARFLGGFAGGGMLVYGPIFISEVAEDSFRGTLTSAPMVMYSSGVLLSYLLGWMLTYKTILWSVIFISVINTLLIASVTESPVFLIMQNRDEDARTSLAHYRGSSVSSKIVLNEYTKLKQLLMPAVELVSVVGDGKNEHLIIEEAETEKLNSVKSAPEIQQKMSPLKLLFLSPSSRRAFCVVAFVISMQLFMGMIAVQVYAKKVFTETDPSKSDLYTVIFAIVLLCGALLTTMVADKAGRRALIILSSVLVAFLMTLLGYLLQSRVAPPWVTVLTIMLYCFSFMFGAGSVPYVLLAEVFVSEVQSLASMMIAELVWFLNFVVIAIFPPLNSLLGIHGTFYCFAFMALINAVVSYIVVPETKGLSKEQIQEAFLGRKKK